MDENMLKAAKMLAERTKNNAFAGVVAKYEKWLKGEDICLCTLCICGRVSGDIIEEAGGRDKPLVNEMLVVISEIRDEYENNEHFIESSFQETADSVISDLSPVTPSARKNW